MNWEEYLAANYDRYVAELIEFVRIPSVSALPQHAGDVRAAAEWTVGRLEAAGVEHVELMETGGHPVVYADWLHAGPEQLTVLIYGHFDVQPVDPIDLWDNDPFEATLVGERLYGRGASDDKGGMMTPIIAVEALLQSEGKLPVNVKFIFEGQEEIGSPNLPAFMEREKEKFACDVIYSSDGMLWGADQPCITLGYKGLASLQINVQGPKADLHSGLHGGAVANPIHALTHIIASMRAANGRILIEGFYDDVEDITDEERALMAKIPFDEAAYQAELDVDDLYGEPGYTTIERNWLRPTLEFNGIWSGFQGEGSKTVLPSSAHAKITCRLVGKQSPEKVFADIKAHIEQHQTPGVRVSVEALAGDGDPYRIPIDHFGNEAAFTVLEDVFETTPHYIWVGGSIALSSIFLDALGTYMVTMAWSVADENLHAPNEFFRLRNYVRGQRAYCQLLHQLHRPQ